MLMDSCGPLIRVVNVSYGEDTVITLNWGFFFNTIGGGMSGGNADGSCSPPLLPFEGIIQVTGYVIGMRLDQATDQADELEDWDVIGSPSTPPDISVPAFQYENIWFGASPGAFLTGPFKSGKNFGDSGPIGVYATSLNGEEGCYFRPDGNPDFGLWGVGLPPNQGPPNATETGATTSFSWPAIKLKHKESGEEWTKSRWNMSVAHSLIALSVTWREEDQNDPNF